MRPIEEVYPNSKYRTPKPGDPNYMDPEKVRSIQVRGQTPRGNANNYKGSRHVANPAWERGRATDERGVPYVDQNLKPIPVKRMAEERHIPRGDQGSWAEQIKRNKQRT